MQLQIFIEMFTNFDFLSKTKYFKKIYDCLLENVSLMNLFFKFWDQIRNTKFSEKYNKDAIKIFKKANTVTNILS